MGWVHNTSPAIEAQPRYPLILGVCISLTVLMVIVVCLRLFVRTKLGRFGAADYVMEFGMVFSIIYNPLCIAQSRYGLRLPLAARPKADLLTYTKVARAWNPTIPGKCLPKARVVCLFLLGLFTTIYSILRLTQIHRVVAVDGDSTVLVLWGTFEFNIGNIVTSLPFLMPLLKMFIRDFRSRSDSELRKSTGYTLQSLSRNQRSQLESEHSKEPAPVKRTPSEELILDSDDSTHRANAEIHVTVEYRVSLANK